MSKTRPINRRVTAGPAWPAKLTAVAFGLVVVLVVGRLLTPDMLRGPWDATPGEGQTAHSPGPATGLVFDLLAVVPALLVLTRRAVDRSYRLVPRWSHVPLAALVIWMTSSVGWSTDRYAAAVTAAHFAAAAAMLWAASQVVRTSGRLRAVAAAAAGLLLALAAQTLEYRLVDVAQNRTYFEANKAAILRAQGLTPGSFGAVQFERTILSGQQLGGFTSPNTLAAVAVLLLAAAAGLAVDDVRRRPTSTDAGPATAGSGGTIDYRGTAAVDSEVATYPIRWWVPLLFAAAGVWLLVVGNSKTAIATPLVGVAAAAAYVRFEPSLRRRPAAAYVGGVAAVAAALLAVVGHVHYHRGLFPGRLSSSLDFRWKYWVASARLFARHPVAGVGWSNFGWHYLSVRLPEASEEIRDPHNFLVRFAVELGVVGLLLVVAWLLRLAWELTRPGPPEPAEATPSWAATVGLVTAGGVLAAVAGVDYSIGTDAAVLLLVRPVLAMVGLAAGAAILLMPRDRPPNAGRWVYPGLLVAAGLFLLHNLIDFSLFETGPLWLLMTVVGAALGLAPVPVPEKGWAASGRLAVGGAVAAVVGWVVTAATFVGPVVRAEALATAGDDAIRAAPAGDERATRAAYRTAAAAYAAASSVVPYDAEYAFRRANAAAGAGDAAAVSAAVAAAERENPRYANAYLLDATYLLDLPARTAEQTAAVRADFDRVVMLNPNAVELRVRYGDVLAAAGDAAAARTQYAAAVAANAALPPLEPKRLTPSQAAELRAKLR